MVSSDDKYLFDILSPRCNFKLILIYGNLLDMILEDAEITEKGFEDIEKEVYNYYLVQFFALYNNCVKQGVSCIIREEFQCVVVFETKKECSTRFMKTLESAYIVRHSNLIFRGTRCIPSYGKMSCTRFLAQCRRNVSFPDIILWTDESTFTPNGVFNCRNFLYWADENPHVVRQGAFQYRWSINVWTGIIGNQVIGPYFLPPRLTGDIYRNFI
ncbi:hypothetical protein X777_03191, partial [Ooceraea biroi]